MNVKELFSHLNYLSYSPPILKLAKPSRLNPSLGKLDSFITMVLGPLPFMLQPFPSCYCVALAFNYNNYYSCFVTHKLTSQNNEEEVKSTPPDWFVIEEKSANEALSLS